MGFNIQLEGEDGVANERVDDPKGLLYDLLPQEPNGVFHYLPFIDRYGDTIFNRPQMEPLLYEWNQLILGCRDLETRRLLENVKRLAMACQNGVHLYLRFVGE